MGFRLYGLRFWRIKEFYFLQGLFKAFSLACKGSSMSVRCVFVHLYKFLSSPIACCPRKGPNCWEGHTEKGTALRHIRAVVGLWIGAMGFQSLSFFSGAKR